MTDLEANAILVETINRLSIEREAMLEQLCDLGGELREPEIAEVRQRRAEIERLRAERDAAVAALAELVALRDIEVALADRSLWGTDADVARQADYQARYSPAWRNARAALAASPKEKT